MRGNFLKFWLSQTISLCGSAITNFAIPIWIYQKHGTASSVTTGVSVLMAAKIIAGPIAGDLVDKTSKKDILIWTEIIQLLLIFLLLSLIYFNISSLVIIYFLLALSTIAETLRFPAMMSSVTFFVDKGELTKANGVISLAESFPTLTAPIIAGAILSFMSIKEILATDLLSFIFSIAVLFKINFPEENIKLSKNQKKLDLNFKANFEAMWNLIKENPFAKLLMINSTLCNIFILGLFVIISPMLLKEGFSIKNVSFVMSFSGFIQIFVSILMTKIKVSKPLESVFAGTIIMGVLGMIVVGISSSYILTLIGLSIYLGLIPFLNTCNRSTFQETMPLNFQGRFFATRRSVSQSLTPLAVILTGFLADHLPKFLFQSSFRFVFFIYGIAISLIAISGGIEFLNIKRGQLN